jgi:hypothetical protein
MPNELVKVETVGVTAASGLAPLPSLVERAGVAGRFAWDEFFYAEHHNPHTQKAYMAAVKRFLGWCEGQGVELTSITPGMVGQYLVGLGRVAGQTESTFISPAGLLRPAGKWARRHPESGGLGERRQGADY